MTTLQQLLDSILRGQLLPPDMFQRDDLDDILDTRDQREFEQPWLACSKQIEQRWAEETPGAATIELIDEIRKQSFLVVSRATRQHEMASYVSDDFELICKALALESNDPYAADLLKCYQNQELPK